MRILLTAARYYPHRGGLESVVHQLSRELQRQGHTVCILTNRYPRTLPGYEVLDGIPIRRLHFLLPSLIYLRHFRFHLLLAGLFFRPWTNYQLRRLVHDFQPDLINSHYLNETAEFVGQVLPKTRKLIPWVISLHGGDVDGEPFLDKAHLDRFRRLARQAGRLTACSGFLARQAVELEPSIEKKIQVIHNGVDTGLFAKAEIPVNSVPYFLAVGQLVRHKGFGLLIDAFSQIAVKYPNVNLLIAGEGEFRLDLEVKIKESGLGGRVNLLGKVEAAKVASLMAGSLFVTQPSHREPFGIVALEGMAAGKCVLATPVGGIPEFLPCPPNRMVPLDESSWVRALDEWLDKAARGQLDGSANRAIAQKYTWQAVTEQYMRIFQRTQAGQ